MLLVIPGTKFLNLGPFLAANLSKSGGGASQIRAWAHSSVTTPMQNTGYGSCFDVLEKINDYTLEVCTARHLYSLAIEWQITWKVWKSNNICNPSKNSRMSRHQNITNYNTKSGLHGKDGENIWQATPSFTIGGILQT